MKKSLLALAATVAATGLSFPTIASADLAFNIGAVSDYRYRGISQSRLKPAVQGGVDWSHASGFYLGAWASSIKWIEDAGTIGGVDLGNANVEIDLYGGYKGEIVKDLAFDVGVLTYQYPRNKAKDRGLTSPNTTEIYGALTYGPATVKYSHAVTELFGFTDSENSYYLDVNATFELMPGLTIVPHVGYQKVAKNKDFSYTDYSVTLNYEVTKGLVLSLMAVDTTAKKLAGGFAYSSPAGKDLGKSGVVAGIKYSF